MSPKLAPNARSLSFGGNLLKNIQQLCQLSPQTAGPETKRLTGLGIEYGHLPRIHLLQESPWLRDFEVKGVYGLQ